MPGTPKVKKEIIQNVVSEAVGDDALDIVFYLTKHRDISEFIIAKDTNIEIHAVRNILYRLHSHHIVTYRRKKDKIKGWYISYWTLNEPRILELVSILKKQKLDKFKERLATEEKNAGNYFLCPSGCTRMDFSAATDKNFTCPECGSILNQQDNSRTIESLQEQIKKLEKELK